MPDTPEPVVNRPKTQIAILGAGSIGCYLGGLLHSSGCSVVYIGRDALKKTLAETGLRLSHFNRPDIFIPANEIQVETTPEYLKQSDCILLCTKSQDTENTAKQIFDHVKPEAHIISCQNGISNVPVLKHILGHKISQISGAIVPFNVTPAKPGHYHCGTDGALHFEHPLPENASQGFKAAKQRILIGGNFSGDQWAKLLVNLNNALNTLTGGTLRDGLLQKDYRLALSKIVQEGLEVAKAQNIQVGTFNGRKPEALIKTLQLPNWAYVILMQLIVKIDAKARSSMLDDLETGRVSEIDYIQGEIVKRATQSGVSAPYNKAIFNAVQKAFDLGASPKLSGTEILSLLAD